MKYEFLGHAVSLIQSCCDTSIIVDPFFSGHFEWSEGTETMLTPMRVQIEDLPKISAICLTHEHGDHTDLESLKYLIKRDNPVCLLTAEILEILIENDINANHIILSDKSVNFINDIKITAYSGYDGAVDDKGRDKKFSFLFENKGASIIHMGDCHNADQIDTPPTGVDLCAAWSIDDGADTIAKTIMPKKYVIFHYDNYTPGAFWCNKDPETERKKMSDKFADIEFIIPEGKDRIIFV